MKPEKLMDLPNVLQLICCGAGPRPQTSWPGRFLLSVPLPTTTTSWAWRKPEPGCLSHPHLLSQRPTESVVAVVRTARLNAKGVQSMNMYCVIFLPDFSVWKYFLKGLEIALGMRSWGKGVHFFFFFFFLPLLKFFRICKLFVKNKPIKKKSSEWNLLFF